MLEIIQEKLKLHWTADTKKVMLQEELPIFQISKHLEQDNQLKVRAAKEKRSILETIHKWSNKRS